MQAENIPTELVYLQCNIQIDDHYYFKLYFGPSYFPALPVYYSYKIISHSLNFNDIFFKVRSSNPDSSDILFPDSDDDFDQDIIDDINEKAAPWWEQQEEAAKRRCQSSCTVSSKGVKPTINLCDDTDVSH